MTFASTTIQDASGSSYQIRLLASDDVDRLTAYFEGLSPATRARYGPHPFDRATATEFCAHLDPATVSRFVVLTDDHIVAYMILVLGVSVQEIERYAAQGITLDTRLDCTFAPSVADAYQDRKLGFSAAQQVIRAARELNRRYMVLMGGTHAVNHCGIHFYRKLGFSHVADFEHPAGVMNHDMRLDLTL